MINRNIEDLREPFKTRLKALMSNMAHKGIAIKVVETIRNKGRQEELYISGASKTLNSKHLIGEAADIIFEEPPYWETPSSSKMKILEEQVRVVGLTSGGILWDWDFQHIELPEGVKEESDKDIIIKAVILMLEDVATSDNEKFKSDMTNKAKDALCKLVDYSIPNKKSITIWQRFKNIFTRELSTTQTN